MWPNVAAPTAKKPIWHREIWPDIRTSRPSERNSRTWLIATFQVASFSSTTNGITIATTERVSSPAIRAAGDIGFRTVRRGLAIWPSSTNLRRGITSSSTKSTMNGTFVSNPCSAVCALVSLLTTACRRPTRMPPAKLNGRFVNAPMAAAPSDCTTSRDSRIASNCCWLEASRTPDTAAKVEPIIQAMRAPARGDTGGVEQFRVVDHRAHGPAGARSAEEQIEPDC